MKGIKKLSSVAFCASNPTSNGSIKTSLSSSPQVPSISLKTISYNEGKQLVKTTMDMPAIGIGTYKFKKGSGEASEAIQEALKLGYRHIDTAFIYGGEKTEKEIGDALASSTMVERSDIFLTSKQWRAYHGYEPTLECLRKSLKRLQTDYLDLYLIHWPGPAYNTMNRRKDIMEQSPDGPFVYAKQGHAAADIASLRGETWRAMEDALYDGKCRAIGVSNFTVRHLEALKQTARIWPPAVNQIELHPYNPQRELVEYCRKEGIVVQAYASLGGQDAGKKVWNILGGKLMEREEVLEISKRYGKTPAQVLLRWATQQGFSVIPKSTNVEHMKMNLEAVSMTSGGEESRDVWMLSKEDMTTLYGLDQSYTREESPSEGEDEDNEHARGAKRKRLNEKARLCWVRDPLKMLDFE